MGREKEYLLCPIANIYCIHNENGYCSLLNSVAKVRETWECEFEKSKEQYYKEQSTIYKKLYKKELNKRLSIIGVKIDEK